MDQNEQINTAGKEDILNSNTSKKRKSNERPANTWKKINIRLDENNEEASLPSCSDNGCSNEKTVESVMEDMETEIDDALDQPCYKNKLTPANVKIILRHVIANEYVLDMVRNTMKLEHSHGEELGDVFYEPKLTRSKAKEMRKKQYMLPWPVSSPSKKVQKVSTKLLEEEFPDESSDDEDYKPYEEECPSDDDGVASSSKTCDFGSLQSTKSLLPSTISKTSELLSEDESALVIALPEQDIPLDVTEEDKIALRTRSKFSLNDTPLEALEASFIAPDITVDMYDTQCGDPNWFDFLYDLSKGPTVMQEHPDETDDVEDDPEYKAPEEERVDYDDLRYDSPVKVQRDELNDLMVDIFECGLLDFETHFEDEEEPIISVENQAPPAVNVGPVCVENVILQSMSMSSDERLQLDEQMRMDEIKMFASREMASCEKSSFYAQNLDGALDIVNTYDDFETFQPPKKESKRRPPPVPQHVKRTLATSKVFIYPELLPTCGFHDTIMKTKTIFSVPEDNLLALGLEQFSKEKNPVEYIHSLLVPSKTTEQIKFRIKNSQSKKDPMANPLKFFQVYKQAPQFQRVIRIFDPDNIKAPEDYSPDVLPMWMETYSKLANTTPVNPVLAPTQEVKPTTVVRPMFRKPLEPRKYSPILPRGLHFSPLKQISPILKKYSQQRHIVPILPFNGSSSHKRQFNKPRPLKPKPSSTSIDSNEKSNIIDLTSDKIPSAAKKGEALTVCESSVKNQNKINSVSPTKSEITSPRSKDNAPTQNVETMSITKSTSKKKQPASEPSNGKKSNAAEVPVETEISDEVEDEVIDDEHEIPAAVVVTTTNMGRKQSVSKKRNRLQRDLEASLALLQPTLVKNDPVKEEREVLFANSYLLRATEILKSNTEVYEKFLSALCKYHHSMRSPVELYSELKEILKDYPALVRDFIVFLRPEQAKECGRYKEHIALSKVREFFRKIEIHFKNQPQHISRILRTFAQLQQQVDITSAEVISALQPLLRNQSHLMEELNHLLPEVSPPEYLMTDFEAVGLPNSDEDNSSIDSCEDILIPEAPDPYGGKECPCNCHNSSTDNKLLNKSRHCVKCGVKFIDGRIYIQTGKVLKPAQVTYHDLPPGSIEKGRNTSQQMSSKTQTSDALSKTAAVPESSKTDVPALKKDTGKNANTGPKTSLPCSDEPVPSTSKLPSDAMEDIVFPIVPKSLTKKAPSDFSQIRNIIESSKKDQTPPDSDASNKKTGVSCQNIKWTRDEDKLIIYNCQRYGISKKAFFATATAIKTRTAYEVEERFLNLMRFLSKEIKKQ